MNQKRKRRIWAAVVTAGLLGLIAGCSYPAIPGHTYLAIDWVYAPEALYFPAFPAIIRTGQYVEHAAGNYTGEYIAWDGSYWRADYWIEVDEGIDGVLLSPADDGNDYYMCMWLYSFGPSMYTDDIVVRSLVPAAGDGANSSAALQQVTADSVDLQRAREIAADLTPTVFTEEQVIGRTTVTVRFERYDITTPVR